MRVIILGGTGHIGTYLVPRLVEEGHEVVVVSRGQRRPYQQHSAWTHVRHVQLDRDAEEARGTFGGHVRDLAPDVVVDMICFTLESAQQLVNALQGHVQHFLHGGTRRQVTSHRLSCRTSASARIERTRLSST